MLCPYLLISINELLISIISFIDINIYGLNVRTAAHTKVLKRNSLVASHTDSLLIIHLEINIIRPDLN